METIIVEIPDNLNEKQEFEAIIKELGEKYIKALTNTKQIGSIYSLKKLETNVKIKRVATEKITVTRECSVCSTLFESDFAYKLQVNYGGKKKVRFYCSDLCRDVVYNICGEGRAVRIRKKHKK